VDFWDITKVLFRRWYVAVPLLVVTAAAAISVGIIQKPLYELTAYIQLVPAAADPGPAVTVKPVNPWNQIGLDALSTAAQLGTLDQTFLNSLKAQGKTPNFTINVGQPPSGDSFDIIGTSQKQVQDTADVVLARFSGYIQSLQTAYGVPASQIIRTQRLDHGTNIARPNGKQLRAVIAVVGSGLLITCAGAIFVDYRARRRGQTGGRSRDTAPTPGGQGPIPPPRRPVSDLVTMSSRVAGDSPDSGTRFTAGAPADDATMTYTNLSDQAGEDFR
jgi:hypothetical protein